MGPCPLTICRLSLWTATSTCNIHVHVRSLICDDTDKGGNCALSGKWCYCCLMIMYDIRASGSYKRVQGRNHKVDQVMEDNWFQESHASSARTGVRTLQKWWQHLNDPRTLMFSRVRHQLSSDSPRRLRVTNPSPCCGTEDRWWTPQGLITCRSHFAAHQRSRRVQSVTVRGPCREGLRRRDCLASPYAPAHNMTAHRTCNCTHFRSLADGSDQRSRIETTRDG